jgi:hypothetical protein
MNEGGWLGVAALAISGLFAWLNKRDALRHDSELKDVKSQNAQQATQIATLTSSTQACKEEHAATQGKLDACEEKHQTTELRLTQIEQKLAQKAQ